MIAFASVMSAPIPLPIELAAGLGAVMGLAMGAILLGGAFAIVHAAVSSQRQNRIGAAVACQAGSVAESLRVAPQRRKEPPLAA